MVILKSRSLTYNRMPRFTELSVTAQTSYAQLFDATLASELSRSVGSLRGSFARKTVKGREYWYFQLTDLGGTLRQFYVGPDSEPVREIDFLTTLHRGGDAPYEHRQLRVAMQPLKFMEYLLENIGQAVVFCDEGAVAVNIPHPARYALHKLLVFGEPRASHLQKARKDLLQAAALLECMKATRAWEIDEAWTDLIGRGRGWTTRAAQGLAALENAAPDLLARTWLKTPRAPKRA